MIVYVYGLFSIVNIITVNNNISLKLNVIILDNSIYAGLHYLINIIRLDNFICLVLGSLFK